MVILTWPNHLYASPRYLFLYRGSTCRCGLCLVRYYLKRFSRYVFSNSFWILHLSHCSWSWHCSCRIEWGSQMYNSNFLRCFLQWEHRSVCTCIVSIPRQILFKWRAIWARVVSVLISCLCRIKHTITPKYQKDEVTFQVQCVCSN